MPTRKKTVSRKKDSGRKKETVRVSLGTGRMTIGPKKKMTKSEEAHYRAGDVLSAPTSKSDELEMQYSGGMLTRPVDKRRVPKWDGNIPETHQERKGAKLYLRSDALASVESQHAEKRLRRLEGAAKRVLLGRQGHEIYYAIYGLKRGSVKKSKTKEAPLKDRIDLWEWRQELGRKELRAIWANPEYREEQGKFYKMPEDKLVYYTVRWKKLAETSREALIEVLIYRGMLYDESTLGVRR